MFLRGLKMGSGRYLVWPIGVWLMVLCSVTMALGAAGCKKNKNNTDDVDEKERSAMKTPTGRDGDLASRIESLDRGTLPFIQQFDAEGLLDYKRKTGITVCGLVLIALLLEVLKQSFLDIGVKVLDYYTSGHITGDWENTVSYFTIAFFVRGKDSQDKNHDTEKHEQVKNQKKTLQESPNGQKIRPMATGPGWFPKTEGPLKKKLKALFESAKKEAVPGRLVALISPHAGYRYSGRAAAAGYRLLPEKTERVVVMGVSHRARLQGISIAPYTHYATPLGNLAIDATALRQLSGHRLFHSVQRAHRREHSVEVQLPFVQYRAPAATLIPLLVGRLPQGGYSQAAKALRPLLKEGTVFIASSDFTHRGPRFGYEPLKKGRER